MMIWRIQINLSLVDPLGKPLIRVHHFCLLFLVTLAGPETCESPDSPLRFLRKVLAGDLSGFALVTRHFHIFSSAVLFGYVDRFS